MNLKKKNKVIVSFLLAFLMVFTSLGNIGGFIYEVKAEGSITVKLRVEGPEYTILPETEVEVKEGATNKEALEAAGLEVDGSGMIDAIEGVEGDSFWCINPYTGNLGDGANVVYNGNGAGGTTGITALSEANAGEEFTVTLTDDKGKAVKEAEIKYYNASKYDYNSINTNKVKAVGTGVTTDDNGQATITMDEAGTYFVTAENAGMSRAKAAKININGNTNKPVIVTDLKDGMTVSNSKLEFTASIKDDNKDVTLAVKYGNTKIEMIENKYTVDIEEGENIITIIVEDNSGNKTEKTYKVNYIKEIKVNIIEPNEDKTYKYDEEVTAKVEILSGNTVIEPKEEDIKWYYTTRIGSNVKKTYLDGHGKEIKFIPMNLPQLPQFKKVKGTIILYAEYAGQVISKRKYIRFELIKNVSMNINEGENGISHEVEINVTTFKKVLEGTKVYVYLRNSMDDDNYSKNVSSAKGIIKNSSEDKEGTASFILKVPQGLKPGEYELDVYKYVPSNKLTFNVTQSDICFEITKPVNENNRDVLFKYNEEIEAQVELKDDKGNKINGEIEWYYTKKDKDGEKVVLNQTGEKISFIPTDLEYFKSTRGHRIYLFAQYTHNGHVYKTLPVKLKIGYIINTSIDINKGENAFAQDVKISVTTAKTVPEGRRISAHLTDLNGKYVMVKTEHGKRCIGARGVIKKENEDAEGHTDLIMTIPQGIEPGKYLIKVTSDENWDLEYTIEKSNVNIEVPEAIFAQCNEMILADASLLDMDGNEIQGEVNWYYKPIIYTQDISGELGERVDLEQKGKHINFKINDLNNDYYRFGYYKYRLFAEYKCNDITYTSIPALVYINPVKNITFNRYSNVNNDKCDVVITVKTIEIKRKERADAILCDEAGNEVKVNWRCISADAEVNMKEGSKEGTASIVLTIPKGLQAGKYKIGVKLTSQNKYSYFDYNILENDDDSEAPVIETDLIDGLTVNNNNLVFTASAKDIVDGQVVPTVRVNEKVINPVEGKYTVELLEGSNKIIIEAEDKANNKDVRVFNIIYDKDTAVEDSIIILDPPTKIKVGEKTILKAKVIKNGAIVENPAIIWNSSDEKIAKFNSNVSGKLITLGSGTVAITAAVADNPNIKKTINIVVEDNVKEVYMRIEGYDHTIMPRTKIEVPLYDISGSLRKKEGGTALKSNGWAVDKFTNPTNAHAIVKSLTDIGIRQMQKGEEDSENLFDFQDYGWSLYIAMIDGDREFDQGGMSGWMYNVNGSLPPVGCNGKALCDGDEIVWYYGAYGFDNIFTKMEVDKKDVKAGEDIKIKLNGVKTEGASKPNKDTENPSEYTEIKSPVENASILVNNKEYEIDGNIIKTNEKGEAVLSFDKPGEYEISAIRYKYKRGKKDKIDIVRPEPIVINVSDDSTGNDDLYSIVSKSMEKTADYMINGSTYSNDWKIVGLVNAGKSVPKNYISETTETVDNYLKNIMKTKIEKVTDYERITIGVAAADGDPENIGGHDLIKRIYNFEGWKDPNTGEVRELDFQGLNGVIYGLIALDTKRFEIPKDAKNTRESLLQYVMEVQNTDGGWDLGMNGSKSDVDITAMTLIALAPYQNKETLYDRYDKEFSNVTGQRTIKEAIDEAVEWLSNVQRKDNGGFNSWFTNDNSESIAQTIIGLCANGIDPTCDKFTKNGHNLIDALLSFEVGDGTFLHIKKVEPNMPKPNIGISTEQAFQALTAYKKFVDMGKKYDEGKTSIYYFGKKLNDINIETEGLNEEEKKEVEEVQNKVNEIKDALNSNKINVSVDNEQEINKKEKTIKALNLDNKMTDEDADNLEKELQQNIVNEEKEVSRETTAVVSDEKKEIQVIIPADAIKDGGTLTKKLKITESEAGNKKEVITSIYDLNLGDKEKTEFEKPVVISIMVPIKAKNIENLCMTWLNEKTDKWIPIPAVIDAETGIVTGMVNHFTKFAVIDKDAVEGEKGTISVSDMMVKQGGAVDFPITISDVEKAAGGQLRIKYNPQIVRAVGLNEGSMLKDILTEKNLNKASEGYIYFAFADDEELVSKGELFSITFRGLGEKDKASDIKLEEVKFNDREGNLIEVSVKNGHITIKENGVLYGDVNGDGDVTKEDVMLILRKAVELEKLDQANEIAADVNGDGHVTAADATLILRYLTKDLEKFPVEKVEE